MSLPGLAPWFFVMMSWRLLCSGLNLEDASARRGLGGGVRTRGYWSCWCSVRDLFAMSLPCIRRFPPYVWAAHRAFCGVRVASVGIEWGHERWQKRSAAFTVVG